MNCYRGVVIFLLLVFVFLTSLSCGLPSAVGKDSGLCPDDTSKGTSHAVFPGSTAWARYSPEKAGLSLELPGEPRPFNLPLPDEEEPEFKQETAYTYSDSDLYVFICHYVSHKSVVEREALRDLTAGFMDSLKKTSGLTDSSTEASGDCKILMRGDYKMKGIPVRFEGFTRRYEANAWIMMVTYAQSDGTARSLAQYAIDSVRIN